MKKYFSFLLSLTIISIYIYYNSSKKNYVQLYTDDKTQVLWYRHSNILQNAKDNLNKSGLIIGNSYSESGINPKHLKLNNLIFYNFTRGGTTAFELALYLQKHQIYPAYIIIEINGRDLLPRYDYNFEIPSPKEKGWFALKNRIENDLRYQSEYIFPSLRYKHFPVEFIKPYIHGGFQEVFRKIETWKIKEKNDDFVFEASGYCRHNNKLEKTNLTSVYLKKNIPKYINSTKFDQENSILLEEIVHKFIENKSKIILLRLPRHEKLNLLEEKGLPKLFSTINKLSNLKHVWWLDLANRNSPEFYQGVQYDGGHWTESQSHFLSKYLNHKIIKLNNI